MSNYTPSNLPHFDEFRMFMNNNIGYHVDVDVAAPALFPNTFYVNKICSHPNEDLHLYVGTMKSLRTNFEATNCHPRTKFHFHNDGTLPDALTEFVKDVFKKSKALTIPRLKSYIKNDDVVFLVIISKPRATPIEPTNNSTKKFLPEFHQIVAVACASFRCSLGSLLLIIGVTKLFKKCRMATFLLTVIDQISLALHDKFLPIYTQVSASKFSVVYGWLKSLLFWPIEGNDRVTDLLQSQLPNMVSKDSKFTWWKSCGSICKMSGGWIPNEPDSMNLIEAIFLTGIETFFINYIGTDWQDATNLFDEAIFSQLFKIDKFDMTHTLTLPDPPPLSDITSADYEEERWGSPEDSDDIYADIPILNLIFTDPATKENVLSVEDLHQSLHMDDNSKRDCFFLSVAQILCKSKKEYYRFRCFFSYIHRCLANLPNKHIFFDCDQRSKFEDYAHFYVMYIEELPFRLHTYCDAFLLRMNGLPEDKPAQLSDENIHRLVFHLASNRFLADDFDGAKEEFMVLSSIFNCEFTVFQAALLSKTYNKDDCRDWRFMMEPCPPIAKFIGENISPYPNYMVALVCGTHYVILNRNQVFQQQDI